MSGREEAPGRRVHDQDRLSDRELPRAEVDLRQLIERGHAEENKPRDKHAFAAPAVADRAEAQRFLTAYDAKHQLEVERDGSITLLVGTQDWPFPVPIVRSDKEFVFDTEAGRDELLNRRIGRKPQTTEVANRRFSDAVQAIGRIRNLRKQKAQSEKPITGYALRFELSALS